MVYDIFTGRLVLARGAFDDMKAAFLFMFNVADQRSNKVAVASPSSAAYLKKNAVMNTL